MAQGYKKAAAEAHKRSDEARSALNRHSHELTKMKRVAADAGENVEESRNRQRKREASVKPHARIARNVTKAKRPIIPD